MNKYTVFCIETPREIGQTTHISSHEAATIEEAKKAAIKETADDWGYDEEDILVLGVATGDVEILEWDDEVG